MTGETIDSIKIEIVGENTDAVSKLDDVIKKLGALKSSAGRQKGLENITKQLGEFSAALNRMSQSSLGRIDRIAEALGKMRGRFSIKEDVPVRITEIGDAVKTLADADFTKLEEMAKGLGALSAVGNIKVPKVAVEGAAKTTAPKSDMTTAESRTASGNVTVKAPQNPYAPGGKYYGQTKPDPKDLDSWGKLEEAGKNAFQSWATSGNQALMVLAKVHPALAAALGISLKVVGVLAKIGRAVLNVSKAIFSIPFKLVKSAIDGIVGKVQNLIRMFKKRMMYRLLNALLSQVSDAFSTGIKNLYEYSALLNGKFASSLDSISTSFLYLKNSIGAMVAPLINALAPAIDFVIDRVVELINLFNQLFALLTGASTWTKALKYPVEYGYESKKASKALKELKKSVLGIDELNQLQDNSNRGGSSGGSSLDYSKMFTEMSEFNLPIKDFIDKAKGMIEEGDWNGLGVMIGEKIGGVFNKINSKILNFQGQLEEKVKNVSNFFTGLFGSFDFWDVGETLANGLEVVLNSVTTFLQSHPMGWGKMLGHMLSRAVNGFIHNFDFEALATNIETIVNSVLDFFIEFLGETDFESIGTKLGEAFSKIDWKTIKEKLKTVFKKAIEGAINGIKAFIKSSGFESKLKGIWSAFKTVLGGLLQAILPGGFGKFLGQMIQGSGNVGLVQWIIDKIKGGKSDVESAGKEAGAAAIKGVGTAFSSDNGQKTQGLFSGWFNLAAPKSVTESKGKELSASVINAFGGSFAMQDKVSEVTGKVKTWLGKIFGKDSASNAGKTYANELTAGVVNGITNPTMPKKTSFTDWIKGIFDGSAWNAGDKTGKEFVDGISNAIRKAHFPTIQYTIPDLQEQRNGRVAINPEIIDTGRGYASGGFPSMGEVYIAREAGPELVGTIGNRNAVMNNEQIVDSVAQGVAEANETQNALLREQNNLLRAILSNSGGSEPMTAQEILSTLGAWNRRVGAAVSPI